MSLTNVGIAYFPLAALIGSGGLFLLHAGDPPARDLAAEVGKAQLQRDSLVREVRSFRRYTIHNDGWKSDATIDVEMIWDGSTKKTYKILDSTAKGFQKTVLTRVLDGEVAVAAKNEEANIISGETYEFKPIGTESFKGRPCKLVELIPKVKSRYVFEGRACIDLEDSAVVWMDGRTTKSVSFWVGRPFVRQEFERIGTFWFSSRHKSVADVKFLGKTEMKIEYLDYIITPRTGAPLVACKTDCRAFLPVSAGLNSRARGAE